MLSAKEVAIAVTKALDEKKGLDIKLLKINEVSSLADYFLICTGTSNTHVKTLCDYAEYTLEQLGEPAHYQQKYSVGADVPVMLFAVGDGNHSLATAKECYERQKRLVPQEQWAGLPARYALVELCDLHDESLQFEPIHRVLFNVDPKQLLGDLKAAFPGAYEGEGEGHVLKYITRDGEGAITVPNPTAQLAVGTLQGFLDGWMSANKKAGIDYIHGEDVVADLSHRPDAVGFLLPAMGKEELFPTVIHDGVLPRKTFSMGHANDKRFYLEARKIR